MLAGIAKYLVRAVRDANPGHQHLCLPSNCCPVFASWLDHAANEPAALGTPGLWGTELGQQLRSWSAAHGRPLIWADREDGPMLLDPLVASRMAGGRGGGVVFSHAAKARPEVLLAFAVAWKAGSPWQPGSFDQLAAKTPRALHFHWPSWQNRTVCEQAEKNASLHVMGVDGEGECVYWASRAPGPGPDGGQDLVPDRAAADDPARRRWECLNDGSCVPSTSSRAVFTSGPQCTAACGGGPWQCVRSTAPNVSRPEVAYCVPGGAPPDEPLPQRAAAGGGATLPESVHRSATSCQALCKVDNPDRAMLCHDWEGIIVTSLWTALIVSSCGFLTACRIVAPRQAFRAGGLAHCCRKRLYQRGNTTFEGRPWCGCLFTTCCPCYQWFRVLAFIFQCPRTATSRYWAALGCVCFTGCCLLNPVGLLGCYLPSSVLCGTCKGAWTRYKLRQQLKIGGRLWEDFLIHCFAGPCAWCQEALEISAAGHSGIGYGHFDDHPLLDSPVVPLVPVVDDTLAAVAAAAAPPGPGPGSVQGQTVTTGGGGGEQPATRPATSRPLLQEPLLLESERGDRDGQPQAEAVMTTGTTITAADDDDSPADTGSIPWGAGHPQW